MAKNLPAPPLDIPADKSDAKPQVPVRFGCERNLDFAFGGYNGGNSSLIEKSGPILDRIFKGANRPENANFSDIITYFEGSLWTVTLEPRKSTPLTSPEPMDASELEQFDEFFCRQSTPISPVYSHGKCGTPDQVFPDPHAKISQ